MEISKKYRTLGIHICVITLFIAYELLFSYFMGTGVSLEDRLLYYFPSLCFFYFNINTISVHWGRSKGIVFCMITLAWLIHVFSLYQIDIWVDRKLHLDTVFKISITSAIFRSVYITGISITYALIRSRIEKTKEIAALKIQSLEYEIAVLRAQVQPHQIYNIHNLVYASIKDKFPQEARALALCSRLIRNSFAQVDQEGKVALSNEIETILTMVELNRMLEEHKIHLKVLVEVPEDKTAIKVPVAMMSIFVLDMFKHGELTNPLYPAIIELTVSETDLHFYMENLKAEKTDSAGLHIGFDNVRQRLQHVYQNSFDLDIVDSDFSYTINLIIKL